MRHTQIGVNVYLCAALLDGVISTKPYQMALLRDALRWAARRQLRSKSVRPDLLFVDISGAQCSHYVRVGLD